MKIKMIETEAVIEVRNNIGFGLVENGQAELYTEEKKPTKRRGRVKKKTKDMIAGTSKSYRTK